MKRLPVVFCTIGVAALAGCATETAVNPAPAPVVVAPAAPVIAAPSAPAVVVPQASVAGGAVIIAPAPAALHAGYGRVESILPVQSAAAGGSAAATGVKRVGLRMDNGTIQFVDTGAENLRVGDRVEITGEGRMRYPL